MCGQPRGQFQHVTNITIFVQTRNSNLFAPALPSRDKANSDILCGHSRCALHFVVLFDAGVVLVATRISRQNDVG